MGLQDGPAGKTATAHLRVQRLELLGLEPAEPDVAEMGIDLDLRPVAGERQGPDPRGAMLSSLLQQARIITGLSQRGLGAAAGVSRSTVVRIEAGTTQPTLPMLQRILSGAGQEMRICLEPYDDHDDVLDNLAVLDPERAARFALSGKQLDAALAAGKP